VIGQNKVLKRNFSQNKKIEKERNKQKKRIVLLVLTLKDLLI
jgi:hypothetical protein